MATYTYKCNNKECENYDSNFDVTQSMRDDSLVNCSVCKNDTLQRVITPAGSFRIPGEHTGTSMWNCSDDPGPARYQKPKIGQSKIRS